MWICHAEEKASSWYARGLASKRKAEAEEDSQARARLYEEAMSELETSLEYEKRYEGYFALGQVELALGFKYSAEDKCSQALGLKPSDPAATACVERAEEAKRIVRKAE
jgi:tetratricopeptide (TPR) repeat protein